MRNVNRQTFLKISGDDCSTVDLTHSTRAVELGGVCVNVLG